MFKNYMISVQPILFIKEVHCYDACNDAWHCSISDKVASHVIVMLLDVKNKCNFLDNHSVNF